MMTLLSIGMYLYVQCGDIFIDWSILVYIYIDRKRWGKSRVSDYVLNFFYMSCKWIFKSSGERWKYFIL